jgi:hypothetical protein
MVLSRCYAMSEIAVQQKSAVFGSHVATGWLSTYHDISAYRRKIELVFAVTGRQWLNLDGSTLVTRRFPTYFYVIAFIPVIKCVTEI